MIERTNKLVSTTVRRFNNVVLAFVLLVFLSITWKFDFSEGWFGRYQGLVYDRFVAHQVTTTDPRIVIVDIDEKSLSAVGRWPWPRHQIAELLAKIQHQQPAVLGLDILFPEPSDAADDRRLAGQLGKGNVVSAITYGLPENVFSTIEIDTTAPSPRWPVAVENVGISQNLEPEVGSVRLGHITPIYDVDYVIRRIFPVICYETCTSTLSLAMLQTLSGQKLTFEPADNLQSSKLCVSNFCLELNSDGTVLIPYHLTSRFRYVSAVDVLNQQTDLPEMAGAMVLVGTSAVGLGDRVATPVSVNTPGVLIHAVLLAGAMDGVHWSLLPYSSYFLTFSVLLIVFMAWLWQYLILGKKLLIIAGWLVLASVPLWLIGRGYWLSPAVLWGAIVVCMVVVFTSDIVTARTQRRKIISAFTSYVPSVVLDKLISENIAPEDLDAQRRDITVLFADIRGFTALSEQLEPEQLVEITSMLFTEITEEIYRFKGTLDKYIGDAVMAFWGAPLPQDNHHQLASQCALAIQKKIEELEPWLGSRGYPKIEMSMGLESGEVTVGNLGSRQRRAYTILGKTANLASHLQRQCESLSSNILFGPELSKRLSPDSIVPIDGVEIRGIAGIHRISRPLGNT